MKNGRPTAALIAIVAVMLGATIAVASEGVSPGAFDRMAMVDTRCPTFSWGMDGDAAAYDFVAYALTEDATNALKLSSETEVLFTRVAGNATSWTPPADQCFAPGGRYVWFVRAVTELIDDRVIDAGEWSAGRYFEVPADPTADELARALDVLKRWEAAGGSPSLLSASAPATVAVAASAAAPVAASGTGTGTGWASPKSVPTASAAIRGEHPDTTGEVYGVIGTSESAAGAGIGAVNLNGGPDLVLDGSVDGEADTRVWEWGIDRASSSDEVFVVNNSAAGVLHLQVEGDIAGTALRAEEVVINGSTVIDGAGAWTGAGDMLPCPGCVGSSDIADGAVGTSEIANDAVTYTKIAIGNVRTGHLQDGAVKTEKIFDGAVTAAKLASGAVGSTALGPDSVDSSHIVTGAVTGAEIADAAVSYRKLEADAVRSSHILDGSVGTAELANGAVTSSKIASPGVYTANLADWSVTTAKIDPGAVTATQLANGAVTGAKIAGGAVSSSHITDGTITAADVNPMGGVYASKSAVYVVTETLPVPAWACQVVTPECNDANDLPLFASFSASITNSDYELTGQNIDHWDSLTVPAEYRIAICQNTSTAGELSGFIACVAVPGS